MTTRRMHSCHRCKGTGSVPDFRVMGNPPTRCRWCNGTGDDDYQDRAYEESRDFADDGKDDYDD